MSAVDRRREAHAQADGFVRVTRSEEETVLLGEEVGQCLTAPAVLLLYGGLGAGKTALVRGICRGLGVPARAVRSPSYTLVNRYEGRFSIQHADLYRLDCPAEVEGIGFGDLLDSGDIVLVEWAERLVFPPRGASVVRIARLGPTRREVRLEPRACWEFLMYGNMKHREEMSAQEDAK